MGPTGADNSDISSAARNEWIEKSNRCFITRHEYAAQQQRNAGHTEVGRLTPTKQMNRAPRLRLNSSGSDFIETLMPGK